MNFNIDNLLKMLMIVYFSDIIKHIDINVIFR